jgi:hypothetical protein
LLTALIRSVDLGIGTKPQRIEIQCSLEVPFSAEMITLPLETRRQLKMAVSVTWIYFDGLLP